MRDTHRLVVEHIRKCRQIPGLQNATVVLVLESNLAYECQHILHHIQQTNVRKWVALQEGASHGIGWLTTNERKEAMCLQLREALSVASWQGAPKAAAARAFARSGSPGTAT